jgi:hypothetical protein
LRAAAERGFRFLGVRTRLSFRSPVPPKATSAALSRSTSSCARSRCIFNCWTIPLKLCIGSPSGEHCNSGQKQTLPYDGSIRRTTNGRSSILLRTNGQYTVLGPGCVQEVCLSPCEPREETNSMVHKVRQIIARGDCIELMRVYLGSDQKGIKETATTERSAVPCAKRSAT